MPQAKTTSLIGTLPSVMGQYLEGADLSNMVWFRTGGPAEVLFRPKNLEDLKAFLKATPPDLPITLVGVGSNLLIRDKGVEGVVIKLGKPFADITVDGDLVSAGAGAMDVTVAFAAAEVSLSGLEFLRGIPGTIGGALRMNAGAYGSEVADVLVSATAIDRGGNVHTLNPDEMGFSYRKSTVPSDWIFVSATFKGTPGNREEIQTKMDAIQQAREDTQPMRVRTGGSTFKNPAGKKAWQLIEEAGCRGLKIGGAMVSEKHCNFLINAGSATSSDLETLGEEVRKRVLKKTGVALHWEIQRVGV